MDIPNDSTSTDLVALLSASMMRSHTFLGVIVSSLVITPVSICFQQCLTDIWDLNLCDKNINKMLNNEPMMNEDKRSTCLLLTSTVFQKLLMQGRHNCNINNSASNFSSQMFNLAHELCTIQFLSCQGFQ